MWQHWGRHLGFKEIERQNTFMTLATGERHKKENRGWVQMSLTQKRKVRKRDRNCWGKGAAISNQEALGEARGERNICTET